MKYKMVDKLWKPDNFLNCKYKTFNLDIICGLSLTGYEHWECQNPGYFDENLVNFFVNRRAEVIQKHNQVKVFHISGISGE